MFCSYLPESNCLKIGKTMNGTKLILRVKLFDMFVERNVFHLKFGNARQAVSLWKEYLEKAHNLNNSLNIRLLTDLTGRGYTIVLELSYEDYAALEPSKCMLTKQEGWKEFYQQFIPLCESTERTQYKLEVAY
ncbi:MAG: hypothetical protein JWQ09_5077 [Segetibacter sp.]|nr:hypothetical protein [Segetibacter sp.]